MLFKEQLGSHVSRPGAQNVITADVMVVARFWKAADEGFKRSAVNVSLTERNPNRTLANATAAVVVV